MSNILAPDEATFGKTGIPIHPTWGIMDSSKIQSLMDCPRGFFYSYILGWRRDEPALHLAFGSAWHAAMEVFLTNGHGPETIRAAYEAFLTVYKEEMGLPIEVLEELHRSKTPSNALKALVEYSATWPDNPEETLHLEKAGTAPISDSRVIHTKLDSIRRYPNEHRHSGKIYSLEHKTAGRMDRTWEDKWQYLFQVGTYDHFLKCLYPPEDVSGVVINGAIFNATSFRFPRIPVIRSKEMWELWIYEANHWWDYLEWNMRELYETSPSNRVMVAFPRNSASCSKFGCRHPNLCSFHANPLQACGQVPLDYKQEYWDPSKREEKDES